jgi:hypothetical protein
MLGANNSDARQEFPRGASSAGSISDRIVSVLRHAQSSVSLQTGFRLTDVQENVCLLTNGDQSDHVKWISAEDKLGQNEVSINQTVFRDGSAPAPRLVFVIQTEGGLVAAWEKLDGADLRTNNRGALPKAFAALGRFHLSQRSGGPVHSNITDKDYAAIGEMLQDELDLHCSLLPDGQTIGQKAAQGLAVLEGGYPTLVHGEFPSRQHHCERERRILP